jgi:hypothetical protein
MTTIVRFLATVTVAALLSLPAFSEESKTPAAPAIYSKTEHAATAQLTAWPGYYGAYYGSYRWRYMPYYTEYPSAWWNYGVYYTPYPYVWPSYTYGYDGPFDAPYYSWPHFGAYGYSYYGPVAY